MLLKVRKRVLTYDVNQKKGAEKSDDDGRDVEQRLAFHGGA